MSAVVVNAAALRTGGALTIYRQFIGHLPEYIGNDKYYIFVDPSMEQPAIDGVTYIHDANHSKLHYVLWSICGQKRWLKKHGIKPSVIVSLQNVGTVTRCRQIIYYHQSLPLYKKKWSFLKSEERTMAFYKYIYPYFVKCTLSANTEVVVQIPFIKKGFVDKFKCNPGKVHVMFPDVEKIDAEKIAPHLFEQELLHFVYPANANSYKEHKTLVNALVQLCKSNPSLTERIRIHLTFQAVSYPSLLRYIKEQNLSAQFVFDGTMPHDKLLSFYKSATGLLFPSTIETLGLPLLEAAAFGLPIVAADMDYSREVMGTYEGIQHVDCYDYAAWASAIEKVCKEKKRYSNLVPKESSWKEFFSLINK